jgi:DNA replication ATP-dependent helicase Dna2
MTPDEMIEFVLAEQRENEKQQRLFRLLSDEAMSHLGRAVTGLMVMETTKSTANFECKHNESRIRPGSHVTLSASDQSRLTGEVLAVEDAGRTIQVALGRVPDDLFSGPWTMVELDRDFTPLIVQSIKKLQPGQAGWSFFRWLADDGTNLPVKKITKAIERQTAVEQVVSEFTFDVDLSQRRALEACVNEPSILGIQGPPGTGKTNLLAMVAESLSRIGRRVLILAPTHQAVNNALAAIHTWFPNRRLVKVGNALRRESLPDDVECRLLKDAVRQDSSRTGSEQIIGMTFLSALQHLAVQSSGLAPNVVLIDEAGQLPFCQGICVGLFGAGSTLLFGDDQQMPPVFNSELSSSPLATSLFARMRQAHPSSIMMLKTSYRLNEPICNFVAESFYGGEGSIISSASSRDRRLRLNLDASTSQATVAQKALGSDDSLIWIRSDDNGSQQLNLTEAELVAKLIATAIKSGLSCDQLAIVTPYRRQAAAIRRMIQYELGASIETPVVDTVERVQGLTVELVAISICTTDSDYASDTAAFLFSANRLNVAVSRARTKVLIFAAESILDALPTDFQGLLALNQFRANLSRVPTWITSKSGDVATTSFIAKGKPGQ